MALRWLKRSLSPNPPPLDPEEQRSSRGPIAIKSTIACAVLGIIVVWLSAQSQGKGAGALWIMFPMIGVAAVHLLLGPAAIILALLSKRLGVMLFVFGYFTFGLYFLVTLLMGGSPSQRIATNVSESWHAFREARQFPNESALCGAFARRLQSSGRENPTTTRLDLAEFEPFDPNFLCRHRGERLPKRYRRPYYRSHYLQLASLNLDIDLVKALLERGADPNAAADGKPPLYLLLTASSGYSVHGAMNQQAHAERIDAGVALLLAENVATHPVDGHDASALHHAAGMGHVPLVERLLAAGADVNSRATRSEETPVRQAIETASELRLRYERYQSLTRQEYESWLGRQRAIVDRLIVAGAEPADVLEAAIYNDAWWVTTLLDAYAIDYRELMLVNGPRYLFHALSNGRKNLFRALVNAGANVNGLTPHGDRHVVRYQRLRHDWQLDALIGAGADVNLPDSRGRTALEAAVGYGNIAAVRTLLARGATVTKDARRRASPEIATLLGEP